MLESAKGCQCGDFKPSNLCLICGSGEFVGAGGGIYDPHVKHNYTGIGLQGLRCGCVATFENVPSLMFWFK